MNATRTFLVKRKYEVKGDISIIFRVTMVAYVEKAKKTSLSIICTTSAIISASKRQSNGTNVLDARKKTCTLWTCLQQS